MKNNLESYQIVVNQLDIALDLLDQQLGPNLKASLAKVLSKEVEQRPAVQMLALVGWLVGRAAARQMPKWHIQQIADKTF